MATQSLYRRFRPRKFSELYGQEHVVKALRNAVINGREGQAYLFSGPRGTGKTTTARILAKVLNCENPANGEPCCECDSCRAVDAGTSYDVLELDAASNNGVQEIRDIIDAAALTSPGRHRVFILDEVHMLSKAASAALLKTLEEPPSQVVFVLATTDPQKVSETIRSRVQHLQFHLLPVDELEKYVRHVVDVAQLDVDDQVIETALRQGGGSARDTLSALELLVAAGGVSDEISGADDVVRALIARDHGAALAAVAGAMQLGRDARTFAEDVIRTMRDCFLVIMAPDLVQLPAHRVDELATFARDLGAQRIVKVMETLGTTMVEMRHTPDARLLLEVAIVRLAAPALDDSVDNILARVQHLEEAVKSIRESGVSARPSAPVNPTTGRAVIGGHATAGSPTGGTPRPAASPVASVPPAEAVAPEDSVPVAASSTTPSTPTGGLDPAQVWPQVLDSLTKLSKALFKPATVDRVEGKKVVVRLPNNTPMARARENAKTLERVIESVCGRPYVVEFVQSDPTAPGGIARPVIENRTIDKLVAEDPFAAVDPAELVDASHVDDPLIAALKESFPAGTLTEDPDSSGPVR